MSGDKDSAPICREVADEAAEAAELAELRRLRSEVERLSPLVAREWRIADERAATLDAWLAALDADQ